MIKNIDKKVKNAIMIGTLCSVSYLAVYFARNILSVVTPQMIEEGFREEYIGSVSSLFLYFYAVGQLVNGLIGDKIKARYMLSLGLIFAGVCNFLFPVFIGASVPTHIIYGMTGFFLSMIYAPMTKVVSENTEPVYAERCSLGYTFASLFGSPLAGLVATVFLWRAVFNIGGASLVFMGALCFTMFLKMEKSGIIKYNRFDIPKKEKGGGIKILLEHEIVKFTFVSVLTGVVRTAVVFWLPTYLVQYLGYSVSQSQLIFTVATLIISLSAFVAIFLYERLGRNMNLSLLITFASSAFFFLLTYLIKIPVVNIVFIILAILMSNAASSVLWSIYCPSLRDTGKVSSATGFLDFMSYVAAGISNTLFATAAPVWGWGKLILVWTVLMAAGILLAVPKKK